MTSEVNKLEIKVNDTEMENEELRERLGMDPKETLDIEDVRHKKKVKAEQAVALNRALTKEVKQGSYRPWKTWKVMEFKRISISRPGNSWNLIVRPGKSWKIKDLFNG